MLTQLSLRLRIFLFFCLLAAGGTALAAGALWFGWSRGEGLPTGPFVTAFLMFAFLNTGLAVGVWLLFDENVAKPIDKLAADLRLRAHSGVDTEIDENAAKYLGDLAPAAGAMTAQFNTSLMGTAAQVARETERLQSEAAQLTALLTEIPVATILLNEQGQIVLYDGQAAELLSTIAPPRLKAPLSDYFDQAAVSKALARLDGGASEARLSLSAATGEERFEAKLKPLDGGGSMLVIDSETKSTLTPRPLVFDFDLMGASQNADIRETALRDLCFVAFDTETTGLSVEKDEVIQLGAVRILNARMIEGEVMDVYVDPGRPIPPASTAVHHISDLDVRGADKFETVGRDFHHFAQDAALVAHNAPFDIGLLRKSQKKMGVTWDHPVLDTVLLSAVVFGTTEQHSLDALCDRLSITIPEGQRHTALGDARATGEALVKLIPLLEAKGITTFGQVVAETQKHGRLLQDLNR